MHFATHVVFEDLTGSFRCFKAFSDVFNTYTSYFQDSRHLPHEATFGIWKESTKVITLRNDLARAMGGDATTEKAEDKISITKEEYDRLKQQAEAEQGIIGHRPFATKKKVSQKMQNGRNSWRHWPKET